MKIPVFSTTSKYCHLELPRISSRLSKAPALIRYIFLILREQRIDREEYPFLYSQFKVLWILHLILAVVMTMSFSQSTVVYFSEVDLQRLWVSCLTDKKLGSISCTRSKLISICPVLQGI